MVFARCTATIEKALLAVLSENNNFHIEKRKTAPNTDIEPSFFIEWRMTSWDGKRVKG